MPSAIVDLPPARLAQALGVPVTEAEIEPLSISGATTDLARVRLSYAEEGAGPTTVIAKVTGRDEVRAAMDAAMGLFAREARFYSELATALPVGTPRCYHAADGVLLLEDLGALRMGDQIEGLETADAERIIDALTAVHAQFWDTPEAAQPWLLDPADPAFGGMVAHLVASGGDALQERFAGTVPDRALEGVLAHAGNWQPLLRRGAEGPKTIAHHDCRLDNIFFAHDNTPVFIDWQAVAHARGTQDVANLLAQCMEPEPLRQQWEPLLHRYHDGLVERGVTGYSWEECQQHYRQNILYAIASGMALLGAMDIGDGRGLGDTILRRALEHVDDIDAFGAF
jgi:aminoglycoside/choline kinase family phosphotransferase